MKFLCWQYWRVALEEVLLPQRGHRLLRRSALDVSFPANALWYQTSYKVCVFGKIFSFWPKTVLVRGCMRWEEGLNVRIGQL